MSYFMSKFQSDEINFWIPCKSKKLNGAKKEASQYYKYDYINCIIAIAEKENDGQMYIITKKKNNSSKWKNE